MESVIRQPSFFIGSTYGNDQQITLCPTDLLPLPTPASKIPPLKSKRQNSFIDDVSDSLLFSEDVVRERCFHMLPYDDKYFRQAIDPSSVVKVQKPVKVPGPMGRINKAGPNTRHMPCIKRAPKRSKPKVQEPQAASTVPSVLHINPHREPIHFPPKKVHSMQKTDSRWDEYLMSILSKNTAKWLVTHRMETDDPRKQKLGNLLHDWHGSDIESELVRDEASEADAQSVIESDLEHVPEKGEWRKRHEKTLLDKVRQEMKTDLPSDPYSEENAATFYRQPAGIRRQKKSKRADADGVVNKLADAVRVVRKQPSPPPSLRDHLPPGVGDKILDTNNEYEQEMLTGNRQVFQTDEEKLIMAETSNKYKKQLQPGFPRQPEEWNTKPEKTMVVQQETEEKGAVKIRKGFRRWKALPNMIDESNVVGTQEELDEVEFAKASDAATKRKTRSNTSLLKILEEWRSKWFLNSRYADATTEDLLRDMADLDASIRLKAVCTLSRALEYNPPDESIQLDGPVTTEDRVSEPLMKGLHLLLEDSVDRVRTAVAITLFALKKPTEKAIDVLREKIGGDNPVDRWAAVQCFAHHGVCDSKVVGELVDQLMMSEDAVRHEQATHLLALLTNDVQNSGLVYSMLAEHLNSTNWRHKVITCKTLPVLGGHISKDIANKLTYLMWFDWHKEVRKAAAQCLGRTGHGKDVHDDLIERLQDKCEKIRADAVSRLGYLGIMTAKLLPVFLTCFDDEHVLIREECCIACGNLELKVDSVIERLVEHASYDPIWRVKALSIQSLGKIGVSTPAVRHCLLWALRYEVEDAVRAEACQSIIKLKQTDEETADILQDRYLVESSPIVQLVIIEALGMFGISPMEDMTTVARVKKEVRKLCAKNNIASQITLNEQSAEREDNVNRFLCQDKARLLTEGEPLVGPSPPPDDQKTTTSAPTQEIPKTPSQAMPPGTDLEIIPEDDESEFYQSRPMTTSSIFTIASTETDLTDATTDDMSPSSGRKSSSKTRKSSSKSRKSSDRKSSGDGRSTRKSSGKTSRRSKPFTPNTYGQIASAADVQSPIRSIRGSILQSRKSLMTPGLERREPLKFHYIMEQIDSFDGMDLSDVIGTLTLNETIPPMEYTGKTRRGKKHSIRSEREYRIVSDAKRNVESRPDTVTNIPETTETNLRKTDSKTDDKLSDDVNVNEQSVELSDQILDSEGKRSELIKPDPISTETPNDEFIKESVSNVGDVKSDVRGPSEETSEFPSEPQNIPQIEHVTENISQTVIEPVINNQTDQPRSDDGESEAVSGKE